MKKKKGAIKYNNKDKFDDVEYRREASEIIMTNTPIKKTYFLVFS